MRSKVKQTVAGHYPLIIHLIFKCYMNKYNAGQFSKLSKEQYCIWPKVHTLFLNIHVEYLQVIISI